MERNLLHRQGRVCRPGGTRSGESDGGGGSEELHGAATRRSRVAADAFAHKGASPALIESLQS